MIIYCSSNQNHYDEMVSAYPHSPPAKSFASFLGRITSKNPPLQTNPRKTESLSAYLFLDSEPKLGKPKESNNPRTGVQVERGLKVFLFSHQKKQYKNRHTLQEVPFNPYYTCLSAILTSFFQIKTLFILLRPLFQRISRPAGQEKRNDKSIQY